MFRLTASTRQPPAGGPGSTAHLDGLLKELRLGERESFLRYFQLFRSPVYDFAHRLLGDETEAVAATNQAIVAAFRRVILDEDVADLRVVTCSSALEVCSARSDALRERGAGGTAGRARPHSRRGRMSDASRRSEAALETLELHRRAALLLHDVEGLGLAETAAVFAIGEEAAGALLFRAREDFRRALAERSAGLRSGTCRQAEQAAAGAVGLGLGDDAVRRLHRHAAYCRPCRSLMKTWGAAPVGLAVLLEQWPLPPALATPPVFGATAVSDDLPAVAATSLTGRVLRPFGRFLRSKAAAYALAAACVALAGGLALHAGGVRTLYLAESVGPAIRLVIDQPAAARQPAQHTASSTSPRPSPVASQSSWVGPASNPSVQVASEPAAKASSGVGSATVSKARSTASSEDDGSSAEQGASKHSATKRTGANHSSRRDRLSSAAQGQSGRRGSATPSQHSLDGRSSEQHSSGGHSSGGHSSGQHSSGQHSSGGHSSGQHSSGQHSSGGHGTTKHADKDH